jgi:hypothetical protein
MYDLINLQIEQTWRRDLNLFEVTEMSDTEVHIKLHTDKQQTFFLDHLYHSLLVAHLHKLGVLDGKRVFRCHYPVGTSQGVVLGELLHNGGRFEKYITLDDKSA